jgi:hypothetical protein
MSLDFSGQFSSLNWRISIFINEFRGLYDSKVFNLISMLMIPKLHIGAVNFTLN